MESPLQTETEQVDAAAMPLGTQAIKKGYTYSDLPKGNIRLLKLLPHRDKTSPLQCSLMDYPLQDLAESNHHLYDSLSYAWGSPEKTHSISIGDSYLPITTNLHAALLRLRDRFLERIIWVDAICINQQDIFERRNQVQRMAMIYALANRVIVWLGEAEDNSDQALEEIYKSADGQQAGDDQVMQTAVLKLLQRSWFKRIWILQEIAAARNVLILCGSSEIDGYNFCMGVNSLNLNYADKLGLLNLIRSATYLIRRKVFHPKQTSSDLGTFSLSIAPLSELIDMYHAREASDCRDKVYALLGMSSDNYNPNDLSPNYDIQWETLLQQVIKLIISERVSISTWQDKEVAIIKSKCCTLGQVSSVNTDATWNDKQIVTVSKYTSDQGQNQRENIFWTLTLPILANSIQKGDIICLLQGASKPTIVRPHKDYFLIVAIAINPATEVLQSVTDFPRDFLLVWDWTKSLSENGEDDEYLLSSQNFQDEKITQLLEKGLLMSDLRSYEKAINIFKRVIENYTRKSKGECSHAIAATTNLVAVYKVFGFPGDHWDEWPYGEDRKEKEERKWRMLADILSGNQGMEKMVLDVLRSCDGEVIRLLPNWSWDQVTITEDILKAAATAKRKDAMELLLDRRGDQIIITEDIIKAAAAAESKDVMELLLERRGDQIIITEDIIKLAATGSESVMRLLLDLRGNQITITEDIVKCAAERYWTMMEVLLDRRGDEITITEDIVKSAAVNEWYAKQTMEFLLDRRGDEITITEDIIKAAAAAGSKDVMELLLERRGDQIIITEDIIKAAAGNQNWWAGKGIMELLLDRRGDEITITENIVKAAAGNQDSWAGREIIELLLDLRGDEVTITEDIINIAEAKNKGVMEWLLNRRGN